MIIKSCKKDSFTLIGKLGSTLDGSNFIQKLWYDANSNFSEIAHLAKKDEAGNLLGIWGAMSDFSMSFLPWENNYTEGLYLAAVECMDNAEAPEGWTKWHIPSFEYLYVECDSNHVFVDMIQHLNKQQIHLAGAVQDFTCPKNKKNYMFFPIKKL